MKRLAAVVALTALAGGCDYDPTRGLQEAVERANAPRPAPAKASRSKRPRVPALVLACIRRIESGGRYNAVSASGTYRGAYQFDLPTWRSAGGRGDPATASPAEQDAAASRLIARRGLQPWPKPSKECK